MPRVIETPLDQPFQTYTWDGPTAPLPAFMPAIEGKFISTGCGKWFVRGVTYGTFRPDSEGLDYPSADIVERDFAAMWHNGFNTVRTYTVPPRWLLDCAQRNGLRVLVGLPWEQHIDFLADENRAASIIVRVREGVRACAAHPAVLAYAVGNEIPASIVRWLGRRRVENFIKRLCIAAKAEDPEALVTYVNYPSTEYLVLPFLDFVCFNVYLESEERLESYLARLQNIAGDRPLVLAEVGLDSRRNGTHAQASVLASQVRNIFSAGCAGLFVFSWTDEWHRGGHDIEDWDFGLTDRLRNPKPALQAVGTAMDSVPFAITREWPFVSVVICTYNGSRTIRDCLDGVGRLNYPRYEVIVVDDGSTDATAAIAAEYNARVITTRNEGLSSARNTGLAAATGEIIAYTDDDARPDSHWLMYLADSFGRFSHAAIGGHNIPPPGDGMIAECVANAPGGPIHVLLSDTEAEHIPGCNMAFRRAELEAIGGFDVRFRTAGDDVDICWRLHEAGRTIGFCPAAFVWHHRRNSVRTYWRQQKGYGRAEALLEERWPERYNSLGHVRWGGRLYGHRLHQAIERRRGFVYHGTWGSAPFQSLYQPSSGTLWALSTMPEWYLLVALLAFLTTLGADWTPLRYALPFLVGAITLSLGQAVLASREASFPSAPALRWTRFKMYALTAFLTVIQPLGRLYGRLRHGLHPLRWSREADIAFPFTRHESIWSERWQSAEERLTLVDATLREVRISVQPGGHFDRWDFAIRGGTLGAVRIRMASEEHGGGKQLLLFKCWPRLSPLALAIMAPVTLSAAGAVAAGSLISGTVLTLGTVAFAFRALQECGAAMAVVKRSLGRAAEKWNVKGSEHEHPVEIVEPAAEIHDEILISDLSVLGAHASFATPYEIRIGMPEKKVSTPLTLPLFEATDSRVGAASSLRSPYSVERELGLDHVGSTDVTSVVGDR